MIGILSNKLSDKFIHGLKLPYKVIDDFNVVDRENFDGLFIDWVPKNESSKAAWIKQAALLQHFIKSQIPIVIFDRNFSLSKEEVNWCKRFNTFLFEPYLNSSRSEFSYLPEWIDDLEILIDNEDREFDLVSYNYNLELYLQEFESWIKEYSISFYGKKIAYSTNLINDFKKEEFKKSNLVYKGDFPIYNLGNITVAYDRKESYERGYFNRLYFYAMNMGCLPLLPIEHKYFHSMFNGLIIKDIRDMDYYISSISKVKNVIIEEIFDRIKKEWNEFTIEHAIDVIKNCYK